MRLGPGPVFVYEWLTAARRWQLYAVRVLFVGAILVGLAFVWHRVTRFRPARGTVSLAELAEYGESVYFTIALIGRALARPSPSDRVTRVSLCRGTRAQLP